MESVGQKLREARLRHGLILEQVSASTRIPLNILRAIEADQLLKVGGAFFYKSFVRQYASQVNLNYRDLEDSVQIASGLFPAPFPHTPDKPAQTWTPKVAPLLSNGLNTPRLLYSFLSLVTMVIACSVVSTFWQSSRSPHSAGFRGSPGTIQSPRPSEPNQQQFPKVPGSIPALADPSAGNVLEPLPSTNDYRIKLLAIERTWLSIVADGKQMFRGILQPSETKMLEGREIARIRTGNAGGVNIEFNGRELGTIGPRGQVRTVVFTKDSYQVVKPAARLSFVLFSQGDE